MFSPRIWKSSWSKEYALSLLKMFVWKAEGGREKTSKCWFTPQMTATAGTGPETPSPVWMAGVQVLTPPSLVLLCALAGSWIGSNRAAGAWISQHSDVGCWHPKLLLDSVPQCQLLNTCLLTNIVELLQEYEESLFTEHRVMNWSSLLIKVINYSILIVELKSSSITLTQYCSIQLATRVAFEMRATCHSQT